MSTRERLRLKITLPLMQPRSLSVFSFDQTTQSLDLSHFLKDLRSRRPAATEEVSHARRPVEVFRQNAADSLYFGPLENFKMSIETIVIIVVVVLLLGGGGWYWGRGRG